MALTPEEKDFFYGDEDGRGSWWHDGDDQDESTVPHHSGQPIPSSTHKGSDKPKDHKMEFKEWTDESWRRMTMPKPHYPANTANSGKWLVFANENAVEEWWLLIKEAMMAGLLGTDIKMSLTPLLNKYGILEYVICVYTYDGYDFKDSMRVRKELRKLGIRWKICYKLDKDTLAGKYADNTEAGVCLYKE